MIIEINNLKNMKNSTQKSDYLWIFILLCISGNPLFTQVVIAKYLYGISLLLFGVYLLLIKHRFIPLDGKIMVMMIFIIMIVALQIVILKNISLLADINFLVKILIGYFIVNDLSNRFPLIYLKVITFVAFISLVVYCYVIITHDASGIVVANSRSILFYTFNMSENMVSNRNAGMFWEPGAFQGYILLVPLMFINKLEILWTRYKKNCIILLLALLTTESTTGYITLIFILSYLLLAKIKRLWVKTIFLPLFIIGVYYAYTSLDFMSEKIEREYLMTTELSVATGDYSFSRLGAAVTDWHHIKQHPIIGNGFTIKGRYGLTTQDIVAFGNGFTGIINILGIPFILLYFTLLFMNSPMKKFDTVFFSIIILLLLQGEQFMEYPIFLSLPFLVKYV